MSFGDDEDILQDFLVEAGEILERLSQQLVDLEQRPDDNNLLNAIFRGFHTVKGGAGFLQLTPMVDCCHVTENLFDILRNGKRSVTPELMDVVLQALDAVNQQFELVSQREPLPPVDPALIAALERLVSCRDLAEADAPADTPPAESTETDAAAQGDITDEEFEELLNAIADDSPTAKTTATGTTDDISEDEFEALLDQLHGKGKGPAGNNQPAAVAKPAAVSSNNDDITDDEFEALLDQLHGKGKGPAGGKADAPANVAPTNGNTAAKKTNDTSPVVSATTDNSDLISEDEFEALLDQLHGKGKFEPETAVSVAAAEKPAPAPTKPAAAKPAATPSPSKPAAPAKVEPAAKAAPAAEKPASEAETTVRVDTARLDEIMNMVGELVLVRNRLVRLGSNSGDEAMAKDVSNLDVVTADLQSAVMKTRMQPIKKVFGRFPRLVRDLARSLKKEINLELVGEETDLDKNLVEALADPLVHLVRNAVDHGIETPEEREAAGKPRIGKVVLSAEQEGDHILLMITDDGKGMDAEILRAKAVEKGLLDRDAAERLSDLESYNLIFAPGFSTKSEISDVSGRGVGMDVVKTKISQLNGTVNVFSNKGQGSRVVIKVPLTLAIMPTLMVMLGDQAFAFPLVSVNEIFQLDLSRTNVVDGQEVVIVRDKALPLFYLKRWLVRGAEREEQREGHVVILSVGNQSIGFVVDQLVGQEEVVIKPLGKMLQGTPGMSGATITGDGRIALILDVPSMLKRYARRI